MCARLARIVAALVLSGLIVVGFNYYERPLDELQTPVITRGLTEEKVIALTFDDGPHPVTTPLLLDVLQHYKIRATFFVVGEKAMEYPQLLRRVAAHGHQIACHTYSHHNLTEMPPSQVRNEITFWSRDIKGITGNGSRYLRPPGGDYDRKTISLLRENGFKLALWSVNPGDWHMPPAERISRFVIDKAHRGAIILMHDDGLNTVHALPTILDALDKQGYRFVTIDEMAEESARASGGGKDMAPPL